MTDMFEWCLKILDRAQEQSLLIRAIGGMAIRLHSPVASQLPTLKRNYADLDFVTTLADSTGLKSLLKSMDFIPHERFNSLQGKSRLIYYASEGDWHLDVFIDVFRMCHNLEFTKADLEIDRQTITLADLWLTKMQVVNLNEKDIKDLATILLEHSPGDSDAETINTKRISAVLGNDWGFYTTVIENISRMLEYLEGSDLAEEQKVLVATRTMELKRSLESSKKTTRWSLRAIPGKLLPWYQQPEEPAFDAIQLYPDT